MDNLDNDLIYCACGCNQTLTRFDKRGRQRRFIRGHPGKNQPNKRVPVVCENCGNKFERPQWHMKRIKHIFCCRECEGEWSSRTGRRRGINNGHYHTIEVQCSGCGKPVKKAYSLIMRRNNRVYCETCIPIKTKNGQKGFYVGYPKEFSPSLRHRIRSRDNFMCRGCGRHQSDVGTLHVHHIDYDKSNNTPENLISLCVKCHGQSNWALDAVENKFKSLVHQNHNP